MRILAISVVTMVLILSAGGCAESIAFLSEADSTGEPIQGASVATGSPTPEIQLAARVNGVGITMEEYEKQCEQFQKTMIQLSQSSSALGDADMRQARRQVLDWMIDQELIAQAATGQGISVSEEELEARVEDIVLQAGGQESFERWLVANGLTLEGFRKQLRSELLGQAIRDRILVGVPSKGEQVHVRHILVGSRKEAEEVLAKLGAGESFSDLAKALSQDMGSKEIGGDLGFFPRGIMTSEFEEAAFALEPGQVSGVVQTPFGFHIIQVLERDPSRPIPEPMLQILRDRAFVRWLEEQREASVIERFVG